MEQYWQYFSKYKTSQNKTNMSNVNKYIDFIIESGKRYSLEKYVSSTFQITRSFLAFATLITIIFCTNDVLFLENSLTYTNNNIPFYNFTFFKLLGFSKLDISRYVSILILISVISGYFYKITSILHWYISLSFSLNAYNVDGGDQIAPVICILLIPITFCDERKNTWKRDIKSIHPSYKIFLSNIFLRLTQLQVAIIYLSSGISKLNVPEWLDGTAYFYWFNDKSVGAPSYIKSLIGNLFSNSYAVTSVTWGTIIVEILLFCCFFSKNKTFRKIMFLLGISFHILAALIHGIVSFCIVMVGCLIIFLRSKDV